jgi:hypothetical protein
MSYLKLPNGIPDFSKAVFSLWFRAPRASVIAAAGHSLPTADATFLMMQNILPILTYGSIQKNANYQLIIDPDIIHNKPPNSNPVLAQPVGWAQHTPYEIDPCFIGLLCYSNGTFDMAFNIQMGNKGSYNSLLWFCTSLDYVEGSTEGNVPGSGFVGTGTGAYKSTIVEGTSGLQDAQNDYFNVITDISLQPDTWHHVLLSFELRGTLAIGPKPSSVCQLWYAIDDTDYRGWQSLGPLRDEDDGLGENIIVTQQVYHQSGFGTSPPLFFNNYVPLPSGGYSPTPIPASGAEIGLPAASHYVDAIFRVEMAELQIFTGVTLDTGVTRNRRAFVADDGTPVDPTGTAASSILGKKPDVMLHGSSDWQEGFNTGTLGIEIDKEGIVKKKPSGQFTPVAGIEPFTPEPSLGETPTA